MKVYSFLKQSAWDGKKKALWKAWMIFFVQMWEILYSKIAFLVRS